MEKNILYKLPICLLCIFISWQANSFAANRTLDRNLEPIILNGNFLQDFIGAPVNELYFFAYNAAFNEWKMIPFQIDEVDANGSYVFDANGEGNGLDGNDELVCMAQDAGDQAGANWLNDLTSGFYPRYEIETTDPLNPVKKAWVYVYRSTSLSLDGNLADYVQYFAPTNNNLAEDRINTRYYEIKNSKYGFPVDLRVWQTQGGAGNDLFDVMKFRAKISAPVVGDVDISEENVVYKSANDIKIKDGRIRVIRKLKATIKKKLTLFTFEADFDLAPGFYYPYCISFKVDVPSLGSGASVSEGRISFDLNSSNMTGSTFLSANNPPPGFIVDGKAETPNTNIDNVLPDSNWISITGNNGTIVHYFPLEKNVGKNRSLYYFDKGSENVLGDTGIKISGGVATPFTMAYTGYYLGPNQPQNTGSDIAAFASNPFAILSTGQVFGSVPVELVTFNASVLGNDVLLQWTTATETNNFGFAIASRTDNETWMQLGFIHGRGTTTDPAQYEFVHHNLKPGTYEYRLQQIDLDGSGTYSEIVAATVEAPASFALLQNYPNPFNPETTISYELANPDHVTLTIYNLLGQRVWTLVNEWQPAGTYEVTWNARNQNTVQVASNLYIYELRAGGNVQRRKMLLLR